MTKEYTFIKRHDQLRDNQIIELLRLAHDRLLQADALYRNHYKTRMVSKADIAEDTDGLSLDLCGTLENLINQLQLKTDGAKLQYCVTHSENGWAIMYQGVPVCNQKNTYAEVLSAAERMKCSLHEDYYDGTTNTWKPRTTL